MITAHGAISQFTTGLYLDHLSRSITGSGPNNIALFVPFGPGFLFTKTSVFLVKAGVNAHPNLSLSLNPSVRCSERERELEENLWEKIANRTKRRDEHQDYKTQTSCLTILSVFYWKCAVKTC